MKTPSPQALRHPDEPPAGAPLWRFSLKGLMVLITLLCVLFALIGSSSRSGVIGLVMLAVLIASHVLGAVVGTRLRAAGTELATRNPAAHGEPDA